MTAHVPMHETREITAREITAREITAREITMHARLSRHAERAP